MEDLEAKVVGDLFIDESPTTREDGLWAARKYSVSKLTMAISDYLVVLWLCIVGYEANRILQIITCMNQTDMTKGFVAFTGIYTVLLLFGTRSKKERRLLQANVRRPGNATNQTDPT